MVLTNIPHIMENLSCMDRHRQSSTNQADHAAEPYLARLHDWHANTQGKNMQTTTMQ
jgi:hypothetical protein